MEGLERHQSQNGLAIADSTKIKDGRLHAQGRDCMGQNAPTGREGLVGRALGSVRDSKRRVCACPCLCGVYVLKPNRRQTRAAAGQTECRGKGKQFVASNFFSGY